MADMKARIIDTGTEVTIHLSNKETTYYLYARGLITLEEAEKLLGGSLENYHLLRRMERLAKHFGAA